MIDLTPLDVRKKKGDFAKALRGYDPEDVDTFVDLVAERLEELVKENLTLKERCERLLDQVSSQEGREKAVQEALVTAQELRQEVRSQAQREADLVVKEAESEARQIVREAEQKVVERREALEGLERKRLRFLRAFRSLLERELDVVSVEEGRTPLEDVEVELDLLGGRKDASPLGESPAETDTTAGEGRAAEEETGEQIEEQIEEQTEEETGEGEAGEVAETGSVAERSAEHEGEIPLEDEAPVEEIPVEEESPVEEAAPPAAASGEEGSVERPDADLWLSSVLQDDAEEEDRAG